MHQVIRQLVLALALAVSFGAPALAIVIDDVGFFVRPSTASLANPVAGKTCVLDSSDGKIKVWNGSSWVVIGIPYVTPGADGEVLTADGGEWVSAPASGGGGGSAGPFLPMQRVEFADYSNWDDLIVSPDGAYVYASMELDADSHWHIAKISTATGAIVAFADLGASNRATGLVTSPDGASVYGYDADDGDTWWKVQTSDMTITHTSTLSVPVSQFPTSLKPFDLSPDGATYAYISGVDQKVYQINTSSYAVTEVTVGHSATSERVTALAWYNGSSTDFYVSYKNVASIDLYQSGVWDSAVNTGQTMNTDLTIMRSGVNDNLFIANVEPGGVDGIVLVSGGSPTFYRTQLSIANIVVNTSAIGATCAGYDTCYFLGGDSRDLYCLDSYNQAVSHVVWPKALNQPELGSFSIGLHPNGSTVYAMAGCLIPELWNVNSMIPAPAPEQAGKLQVSDGKGNWLSSYPYNTTGWSGSDTIGGGGTVTVTTAIATTSSKFSLTPTVGTSVTPAVTTKSNGSFVVTGNAGDTFDWVIVKP